MKESKKIFEPVELNDEELKAVVGGFFNNSFGNFANGGNAAGGTASGSNSVANGGFAGGGANNSFG
jgi:bacteriocin-like protein